MPSYYYYGCTRNQGWLEGTNPLGATMWMSAFVLLAIQMQFRKRVRVARPLKVIRGHARGDC